MIVSFDSKDDYGVFALQMKDGMSCHGSVDAEVAKDGKVSRKETERLCRMLLMAPLMLNFITAYCNGRCRYKGRESCGKCPAMMILNIVDGKAEPSAFEGKPGHADRR